MNFFNTMQVAIEVWTFAFLIVVIALGIRNDIRIGGTVLRLLRMLFLANLLIGFDAMTYAFRYREEAYSITLLKLSIYMVFLLQEYLNLRISMEINIIAHNQKKIVWDGYLLACVILLGITMLCVLTNPFTKLFFYFDEMGNYTRTPLIVFPFGLPIISIIINMVSIIKHKKNLTKRVWQFFIISFSLMVVAIFIQVVFSGVGLVNVACAFCILIMYVGHGLTNRNSL